MICSGEEANGTLVSHKRSGSRMSGERSTDAVASEGSPSRDASGASPVTSLAPSSQAVLESCPDALLVVGEDGTIRMVNAATERMLGYAREELVGQDHRMVVAQGFRSGFHRLFSALRRDADIGALPPVELYGLRRDGSEFQAEITCSLVAPVWPSLAAGASPTRAPARTRTRTPARTRAPPRATRTQDATRTRKPTHLPPRNPTMTSASPFWSGTPPAACRPTRNCAQRCHCSRPRWNPPRTASSWSAAMARSQASTTGSPPCGVFPGSCWPPGMRRP